VAGSKAQESEEPPQVPAVGLVQGLKDDLASKEAAALEATPDGMEFAGWIIDGWLTSYPLHDPKARPVYAFTKVDHGD